MPNGSLVDRAQERRSHAAACGDQAGRPLTKQMPPAHTGGIVISILNVEASGEFDLGGLLAAATLVILKHKRNLVALIEALNT